MYRRKESDRGFPGESLLYTVKELQSKVFKEGNPYCCLLGPDPQTGIFSCGDSVAEALADWDSNLRERLNYAGSDDETTQYARGVACFL